MAGPSGAKEATEGFQRLLAAQDAKASAQVVRAYAPVYQRLQRDTRALVTIAQTRGLKPWQVMRMQRMKDLQTQFRVSAARFATAAGNTITEAQRAAVGLAQRGARATVGAGLPPGVTMDNLARLGLGWNRLPEEAFANFVGIAADGAPIGDLLAPLGPQAAGPIKDAIGSGIALGKGPRETARLVRMAAGMPLSRALLITRTETNRAFREATRMQYASNSQVVKGYRRLAAHSERTCMACISLDGKLYPLDEPLNEHPNGRCALVPETLTYEDLGLDVQMPPQPENARQWLSRQPEGTQRGVLGNARYDAIQRGELRLDQLATIRQNAVWGDAAVVRPLKDLGLREGVGARRPTDIPLRKRTELTDPLTGRPVRGTRTAPPEPTLPKEWRAEFGDSAEFLDVSPAAADPSMIKYRGPTGREAITAQVKEQEAWARAVGGAVEADYTGLSIKAARDTNLAIARTILRHNMRSLDRIATGPYREGGRVAPFGNNTLAYQLRGNVHINLDTTVHGSVRGWSDMAVRSQRQTGAKLVKSREALAELETNIATKRLHAQTNLAERRASFDRSVQAGAYDERAERIVRANLDRLEADLKGKEKEWRKAIREHKTAMRDVESGRWGVYTGSEVTGIESPVVTDLITHEIGHFAHRRYGYYDKVSLDALATSKKTYETVERFNPRTGRITRKRQWDRRYKPQRESGRISEYATTNDHEYFAEAWADYHANNGIHLTDKVRGFIEEVIEANARFADVQASDRAGLGKLNKIYKARVPLRKRRQ